MAWADHEDVNQYCGFRIGNQEFTLGDFAKIKKNGCPEFESQLDKRPKYIQIMRVFEKGKKKSAMVLWFIKAEHCTSVKLLEGVPPLEKDGELLFDRREIPGTIPLSLIEGSTTVTNIKITDIPKKFLRTRQSFFVVRFGLYERHGSLYVKPALLPSKQAFVNGNEAAVESRTRPLETSLTSTRQNETSPQKARTRPAEASLTRTRQNKTSPQKAKTRPAETSVTRTRQNETSPQKARTRPAETSPQRDRTRQADQSPARTRSETSHSQPDRSIGEIPESPDITVDEDSPPLSLEKSRVFLEARNNKRKLFVPSSQDVRTQPKTPEKPYMKPYHPVLGADFDAGPSEAVKISPRRRVNEQSPIRSPYSFAVYDAESQSAEKRTRSQTRNDASPERPLNANTQWASQDLTYSPDKSPVRLRIFRRQNVREVKNTGQNTGNVTVQNKKQPSLFGDSQNSSINTPVDLPFPKKAPTKSVLANAFPVHDDEDDNDLFFDEVPQRQQPKQKKITEYSKPVAEETTSLEEDSSGESTNELVNQVQQTRISFKMPRFADDKKSKSVEFQRITRSGASINEPTPSTSGIVTRRNGPVEPVASTSQKAAVGNNSKTASTSGVVTSKISSVRPTASTSADRSGRDRPTASTSGVVTSKDSSDRLTANTSADRSGRDKRTASTSGVVPSRNSSDRPTTNLLQNATRNGTIEPIASTSRIVTRRNSTVEPTASTSRIGIGEPTASTSKDTTRKVPTGRTSQISTRSVSDVSPTKSTVSSMSEEEDDDNEPTNNVKDGFLASDSDHDDRLMCDGEQKKETESPKKCLFIDVNRRIPKPAIVTKSTAFEDSDEDEPPPIPSPLKAARKNPQSSFSPVRVVVPSTVTSPTRMSAMPCNTSPRKSAMDSESTATRTVPYASSSPRMSITNSGGRLNFSFSERRNASRLNSSFSETNSRNQLNSSFPGTRVSPRKSGSELNPNMNPSVRLSPLSDSVLQKLAESSSADRRENQRQEAEKVAIKSPNTVQRQLFSSNDEQPVVNSNSQHNSTVEAIDQAVSTNDGAVPGCSGLGAVHSDASTDSDSENPLPKELRREMRSSPKKLTNANLNTSRQELLDCLTTPASPNNCELDHNNSRLKLITSLEDNEVEQHPVMKLFDKNLSLRSSQSENEDSDSAGHSAGKRSLLTNSTQSSPSMSPIPSSSTILKTRTNSSFDSSSYHTARSHGSNSSQTIESPLIIDTTPETVTCRKRKRKSVGLIRIGSSFSTPSTPAAMIQQNPNKDTDNESSESVKVRKKNTSVSLTDSQDSSISGPSKTPTRQLVIEDSDNESSESVNVHKKKRKSLRIVTEPKDSSISGPSKAPTHQLVIEESDNDSSESLRVGKKNGKSLRKVTDSQDSSISVPSKTLRGQGVIEESDNESSESGKIHKQKTPVKITDIDSQDSSIPALSTPPTRQRVFEDISPIVPTTVQQLIPSATSMREMMKRKLAALESEGNHNLDVDTCGYEDNIGDTQLDDPSYSEFIFGSADAPRKSPRKLSVNKPNSPMPSTSKDDNYSKPSTSKDDNYSKPSTSKDDNYSKPSTSKDSNYSKPSTSKSNNSFSVKKITEHAAKALVSPSQLLDILNEDTNSMSPKKFQSPAKVTNKSKAQSQERKHSSDTAMAESSSDNEDIQNVHSQQTIIMKPSGEKVNYVDVNLPALENVSINTQLKMIGFSTSKSDSDTSSNFENNDSEMDENSMAYKMKIAEQKQLKRLEEFSAAMRVNSPQVPRKLVPDISPEIQSPVAPDERSVRRKSSTTTPDSPEKLEQKFVTNKEQKQQMRMTRRQSLRSRATQEPIDRQHLRRSSVSSRRASEEEPSGSNVTSRNLRARTPTPFYSLLDSDDSSPEATPTKRGRPAKVETAPTRDKRAKTPTRFVADSDSEDSIPEATPTKRGRPAKVETAATREKRAKTPTRFVADSDSEDSIPEATPTKRGRPAKVENAPTREKRGNTPTHSFADSDSEDSIPEATPTKRGRPAKVETAATREKRAKTPTRSSAVLDSEDFIPEATPTKRGRPAKVETAATREKRAKTPTRSSAVSDTEDFIPEATPTKRGRPAKVETAATREKRAKTPTCSSAVSDTEDFIPEATPTKRGRPAKVETAATREKRAKTPTRSSAVSDSEDLRPEATPCKRGRPAKVETAATREKRAKTPTRSSAVSDTEDFSPEATPAKRGRPAKSETKTVATQIETRNRGRPPKSQKVEEKSFKEEPRTRGRPPASQKDKEPKGKTKKAADKRASSRFLSPTKVDAVEEQEMPGRETEMASIRAFVQRKFEEASGGCMYISGVPGTGKTASVSQVILQLQRMVEEGELPEFKLVKASGMELTQPLQLFSLMARELLDLKLSPSLAQSKLASYFANKGKNRPPTLLIIDELDMLCTRRQDVVYSVFDWPSQTHARLTVLAIANTMDLPERLLKGRVTSRLGLTRLSFKPYTFDQLQQIVMVKLSEAKKFDKDALQLVARKVASVSGDARRAMDVCRRAAEVAGVGKLVEMPHVMSALNEMLSSPIAESVRGCSKLAKHLLRCLLSEMKRTGLEESTLKAVFITMNSTASFHNIPMCSLTQASETVAKLASSRLLRAVDSESGSLGQPLALSVSADDLHYALNVEN